MAQLDKEEWQRQQELRGKRKRTVDEEAELTLLNRKQNNVRESD